MESSKPLKLCFGDIVIILIVLTGIIWSYLHFYTAKADSMVFVYKDNELWGTYSLTKDRVIVVDEHNTIEIKDSKVSMKAADCPDKRCMKQGGSNLMPIICLPNKLVIEIKQDSKAPNKFILY